MGMDEAQGGGQVVTAEARTDRRGLVIGEEDRAELRMEQLERGVILVAVGDVLAGAAEVSVDGDVVGEIGAGFVVLVGVAQGDGDTEAQLLAEKTASLRVFEDDAGKMNLSLLDIGGDALVVSQFTLFAECRKGRRPSFGRAAPPLDAERLYELYVEALREAGVTAVETGVFAAKMLVEIANDGPVTIMLDTDDVIDMSSVAEAKKILARYDVEF